MLSKKGNFSEEILRKFKPETSSWFQN